MAGSPISPVDHLRKDDAGDATPQPPALQGSLTLSAPCHFNKADKAMAVFQTKPASGVRPTEP
jgi:hypothetical protein